MWAIVDPVPALRADVGGEDIRKGARAPVVVEAREAMRRTPSLQAQERLTPGLQAQERLTPGLQAQERLTGATMHKRRSTDEGLWAIVAAGAATVVAWVVFSRLPPMPVRMGSVSIDALVPTQYQVSVFPAFAAFVALLAIDVARAQARHTWAPRAALVAVTGVFALVRLSGAEGARVLGSGAEGVRVLGSGSAIPISGHALFLGAALAYALAPPVDRSAHVIVAVVIPGLLVTGWYKLVVWGDGAWFAASLVLGAAMGALLARRARA
jgi:hypothetical protein